MPKVTRGNDSPTPKKRSRKVSADTGNGAHSEVGNGNGNGIGNGSGKANGAQIAQPVAPASEFAVEAQFSPSVDEKIRARAYELYLQRGGDGGSPEQDWLQAKEEICGQ